MNVKQFYDKGLAHASYAIESKGQVALVDPGRDIKPYEDFARQTGGKIVTVLETHPHADFVSSHLELQKKYGAKIYVNPKAGVDYDFESFEDGDELKIGDVTIKAVYTPGHSPDHNTYLLFDENGKEHAAFTGDSLFVGDVGRPDLREGAGRINMKKEELAEQMYDTVQNIFKILPNDVLVYPAHRAGSFCGKNMSSETYSTIGKEKENNWAFRENDRKRFIEELLNDQPVIPKYFPYDVELNRKGAPALRDTIDNIPSVKKEEVEKGVLIIDVRSAEEFKKGHLSGAINIPDGAKFESWLGTLIAPGTYFYLAGPGKLVKETIYKAAKIGYEPFIKAAVILPEGGEEPSFYADAEELKAHPENFTIIDLRNPSEVEEKNGFGSSLKIPLASLPEDTGNIPGDKPVVVHCAGGYRSAIGASIIQKERKDLKVFDLGEKIKEFL